MARTLRLVLIAVVVIVVAAVGGVLAIGSQPTAEDVAVRVGSKTAGIFLNLRNNGLLPDCVVGVEAYGEGKEGRVQLTAELHTTVMEGNVMRMVKVDRVCVGPLSVVKMRGAEGEGYHVMVFGDVEKVSVFHVYLKLESGKVVHFHVMATEGSQMGGMHESHSHG
ncbi:MAG: copper chaperone PCu(A)C [Nitrososphaerota archaeon]